jgi:type IV pilus assembly protein PilE
MTPRQFALHRGTIAHRLVAWRPSGRCAGGRDRRGFTLVELLVVMAAAGVLGAVAWPSFASQMTRARRADATGALLRLEAAQARYHALHGLYAANPSTLGAAGSAASPQGLYRIELLPGPTDGFTAAAYARADGAQAGDRECTTITLRIEQGFAQRGPSAECWAR